MESFKSEYTPGNLHHFVVIQNVHHLFGQIQSEEH